ncbi:MAG: redox-regulated ATPase YchF [Acidobacteria bacterium]|nr:redox-regulated ATPase YchF [Acidobacteriota bacterium]
MKIGLVGFPGCGKTTVFNALTGLDADTGYGTAKPGTKNLGVVRVPDDRVDQLTALYSPKKTTYAEITFCDIAGGTGSRELDRSVLNSMREMDALCQVLRAFDNPAAAEVADPDRELQDLQIETVLADLEIVERRVDRLRKDRSDPQLLKLLERILEHLESEQPLRSLDLDTNERKAVSGYQFLSLKPLLIVLNVAEDAVAAEPPAALTAAAEAAGSGLVVLSAAVEMDIAQMPEEDRAEFYEELGLGEPASHRFVRSAFQLLQLITMLTAGPDECRAWPVRAGSKAPVAAGKIHSDIERGFIRAEVTRWDDLVEHGSEAQCRELGKLRVEGRDYTVQDGDVCHFRFNV